MNQKLINYQYAISLNFALLDRPAIFDPNAKFINSMMISSRRFKNLQNAAKSCDVMMSAWVKKFNEISDTEYTLVVEINPELSRHETYSNDWQENELSKLWIIPADADLDHALSVEALGFANLVEISLD